MKLAELQHEFVRTLRGETADTVMEERLRHGHGEDIRRRLDTYRNTIRAVRFRALSSAYPVCVTVLGEPYWRQLVSDTGLCPGAAGEKPGVPDLSVSHPGTADLNAYGEQLPGWLTERLPLHRELTPFPYLPDLARLEWAVHRSRFAADGTMFDFDAFASLDEVRRSAVRFLLAPSLSVFRSAWPVDVIWHRHAGDGCADLSAEGPAHCCVTRGHDFAVRVTRIGSPQAVVLSAISAGATLLALEHDRSPKACERLADWLCGWIRVGWITGFEERGDRV